MFSLNEAHKCYLCPMPMDMQKGFDTLSGVVRSQMKRDPLSGEVFIYENKNRNTIKLLHWEKGGFVLYHKRLERGNIELPKYDEISGSYKLQRMSQQPHLKSLELEAENARLKKELLAATHKLQATEEKITKQNRRL
ncbi:MAG: IS66 family insertion sequence element accessory protein TnpB [Bacteroidales bacterium]